jgi:hypothetical protein
MTMHLAHPSLSMGGKRKGKIKFKNAAEAKRARELESDWKDLQKKWGVGQDEQKRRRAMRAETLQYSLTAPAGRSTKLIPSRSTGEAGVVTYKESPQYTGTKMLGIGQLHKSNAVPVFCDQDAIDIARMRRG